jgi:hypothetical protein
MPIRYTFNMAHDHRPWYAAARRGHGALILIVLITLAIALYLMFGNMGGTSYMQQVGQTKQRGRELAQDLSTRQLSILIAQYRTEQNRLPKTAADLDNEAAFRDQWGGPITFTFEEAGRGGGPAGTTVIYRSNGPDGIAGTEDDIEKREILPY